MYNLNSDFFLIKNLFIWTIYQQILLLSVHILKLRSQIFKKFSQIV